MADRFWKGGSWSDTANWSATQGGAGGASVPTAVDNVYWHSTPTSNTYTIDANPASFLSMDWTGANNNPTLNISAGKHLRCYGKLTLIDNMTISFASNTSTSFFSTTTGQTITLAGKTLSAVVINGVGGSWTLQDDFNATSITITNGVFNTNNKILNVAGFVSNSGSSIINLGSSVITITDGAFDCPNANTVINAETSTIKMINSSIQWFYTAKTLYNVEVEGSISIDLPCVINNLKISLPNSVLKIAHGVTLTVSSFLAIDAAVNSNSAGEAATISCVSGTHNLYRCTVKDITFTGGAVFNFSVCTNVSGNTGFISDNGKLLYFHQDSYLWGFCKVSGMVYKWIDNTGWSLISDNYVTSTHYAGIKCAVYYRGNIYIVTNQSPNVLNKMGKNGGDFVPIATGNIESLIVYNDKLYGGGSDGNLYEWSYVLGELILPSPWIVKTNGSFGGGSINTLSIFSEKLYGGTSVNGTLLVWNDVDAWTVKASINNTTDIFNLIDVDNILCCISEKGYFYFLTNDFETIATGLQNTKGNIFEYNTQSNKYTILVNGTDKKAWDGTTITDLTNAPATKLYCSADNRIYALMGSLLKYCAAGLPNDWTLLDDAGEEVLSEMIGSGSALIAYNDMKIAFSEQTMHIMYGKNTFEYSITSPFSDGCVGHKALIVSSGVLYFVDFNKIKAFTGSIPVDISQKVKTYLELINYTYKSLICVGKWGKYVYFSIPYGTSSTENTLTLEYDTELRTWYPIDRGFSDFITLNEDLYGVDNDGVVWKLNQGLNDSGTAIVWNHDTGVQDSKPLRQKKTISDIYVSVDLPVASTMNVYYSLTADLDDWVLLYTLTGNANEQTTRIQIPTTALQNVPWYRLRFSGTGYAAIHYWEPHIRVRKR